MSTPTAQLIDGKAIAAGVRESIRARVAALGARGRKVRLDAVLAAGTGDDAARLYAHNQAKMCAEVGIDYQLHELPGASDFDDIAGRVLLLGQDEQCHAIMVHMPLPDGVDAYRVQSLISAAKDVEGVNPANIGNIVYGRSSLAPCTALAVMRMIDSTGVELRGKTAVVVGASNIVGKPVAVMLMQREATVMSLNKYTPDAQDIASRADILVSAAGVPALVKEAWVKPGAVVIDVGTNRVKSADGSLRTVGDVDFQPVSARAAFLSPVPGGVGPVTVAMLLENVVASAERA